MVGTIAPLVQVARRQWLISTGSFVLASIMGGSAVGVLLGVMGNVLPISMPTSAGAWLLAAVAVVLALVELRVLPLKVPTLYRSVPQHWWIRYGPTRAALAYGGILGMGITTFVPLASFYLIPLAAILLGPADGGIIGASYGLGRALPVPLASLAMASGVSPSVVGRWVMAPGRRQLTKGASALTLLLIAGILIS